MSSTLQNLCYKKLSDMILSSPEQIKENILNFSTNQYVIESKNKVKQYVPEITSKIIDDFNCTFFFNVEHYYMLFPDVDKYIIDSAYETACLVNKQNIHHYKYFRLQFHSHYNSDDEDNEEDDEEYEDDEDMDNLERINYINEHKI